MLPQAESNSDLIDNAPLHASREDYQEYEDEEGFIHWPRDPRLDPAKYDLISWFKAHPTSIFYGRQMEVILEKKYFHWITHKALRELTLEGEVSTEFRITEGGNRVRLYWWKGFRYPKRAMARLVDEIDKHSRPDLTKAIGHHAEILFGFEASRAGFVLTGPEVSSHDGRAWTYTEHDLDWIFKRDGVAWGVEIKNTWAYIDRGEMELKIAMCGYLGLRPLFIMRWAPKSYIELIRRANGFGLLYETQYFPLGREAEASKLNELLLPAKVVPFVPKGVFERFIRWHEGG